MSKLTKTFHTEAHQTVTWTYDSGESRAAYMPLDAVGSWTCGGCTGRGHGKPYQAQQHAARCRKTNVG